MALFASDAYTDTDGTFLPAHLPTGGGTWTEIFSGASAAVIYSNVGVVAVGPSTLGYFVHSATPPSADYEVALTIQLLSGVIGQQYCGVIARVVDANNLYRFFNNPATGAWQLDCVASGAITVSDTYAQAVVAGTPYTLRIQVIGTSIKGFINGVERCALTDGTFTAAGKAGSLSLNLGTTASLTLLFNDWSATSADPTTGTFAADTCVDADATPFLSHAPTGGGSWSELLGPGSAVARILSNLVMASVDSGSGIFVHSATPPSPEYAVQVNVYTFEDPLTDEYLGVVGRCADASNMYRFIYDGTASAWVLGAVVGGSVVASDSFAASITIATPYTARLVMVGTSIDGYLNGVLVCHLTNSAHTAAGKAGLLIDNLSGASPSGGLYLWSATALAPDTIAPTITGWTTNAAGTVITGTLSEAGCLPASGTGGFTLGGTSATVASWAIAGTTVTLTLTGTIAISDTVTISYDDASTTDDITDASANPLADITSASVANVVDAPGTPQRVVVTVSNASGTFDLVDYQIKVDLSRSEYADLVGNTRIDGADLVAYAADGTTVLNFWLAPDFVKAPAAGSLYIKIASLQRGHRLDVVLKCGDPAITTTLGNYTATMTARVVGSDTLCLCHCNDASGSTLTDAAGLHNGTVVNGPPTWDGTDGGNWKDTSPPVTFSTGSAVHLNGSSQYVTFGSLFDTWPAAWFVSCWFKPDVAMGFGSGANYRLLTKWNGAPGTDGLDVFIADSASLGLHGLYVNAYRSSLTTQLVAQTTAFVANVSHHLVVTGGPAGLQLYLDGRLHAEAAGLDTLGNALVSVPGNGSAHPFSLGVYNGGTPTQWFDGAFDEFQCGSHQMLPEEVHAGYERRQYQPRMELSGRMAALPRTTILAPTGTATFDQFMCLEPTVVRADATTWTMLYTGRGSAEEKIGLATSVNGDTWTKHGSSSVFTSGTTAPPAYLANSAQGSCLLSDGAGGYLAYYSDGFYIGNNILRRTSADGITWSAETSVVQGIDGTWRANVCNPFVYRVSATEWYMLVAGTDNTFVVYLVGLFTSTDGLTWWEAPGVNPLRSLQLWAGGSYCLRHFDKVGSTYRAFTHHSLHGFGPSNIGYWESEDLITWRAPWGRDPVMFLNGETLLGGLADQVADPWFIDTPSHLRIYYDVDRNTTIAGVDATVDMLSVSGSLAQLLTDWPTVAVGGSDVDMVFFRR